MSVGLEKGRFLGKGGFHDRQGFHRLALTISTSRKDGPLSLRFNSLINDFEVCEYPHQFGQSRDWAVSIFGKEI